MEHVNELIHDLMANLRARMLAPVSEPPFAQCGCGRQYTLEEWIKLECCGAQSDGDGTVAPLRNCDGCGSTIAPLWASEEREAVLIGSPLEHLRDAREVV